MKYSYDIITIGGVTEDITFTVDDAVMIDNAQDPLRQELIGFEYGSKIGIKEMRRSFGGGAANVAVAYARLGLKAAAIISIGRDEGGKKILKNLTNHRIDCRFVHIESKASSGLSLIVKTPSGDHILFTYRGANDKLVINKNLKKKLAKAKRLYISSLTGNWRTVLEAALTCGTPVAWNPGRIQLLAGFSALKRYLKQTDIFILNRDEATELVASTKNSAQNFALGPMLRHLNSFGPRLVVITEGAKGSVAFDGKKMFRQKVGKGRAIDTTGVGDSFSAAFVAAIDKDISIQRALALASKNASSVVAKPGAQHGLLTTRQLGL